MELITTDRTGLLSIVGKVLSDQSILITNAKITTISSRVEDIFFITNQDSKPITDPEKQQQIKQQLLDLLN
jgi:[protein-PII] uridylyltransferase